MATEKPEPFVVEYDDNQEFDRLFQESGGDVDKFEPMDYRMSIDTPSLDAARVEIERLKGLGHTNFQIRQRVGVTSQWEDGVQFWDWEEELVDEEW